MQRHAEKQIAVDDALQADGEALHRALGDLVRVYQYRDRDRICCHDISVSQCHALEALVDHGPMRLNALAERLLLDKSTASRLVDGLARKGYAERLADTDDARALALRATPSGRRLYGRIRSELVRQQQELVADLPPAARRAAIDVITRLARDAERKFGVAGAAGCAPKHCSAP
jgi:MarR family transcriptional regulator, 2-MHQ and catechol-resistance regulon repressor